MIHALGQRRQSRHHLGGGLGRALTTFRISPVFRQRLAQEAQAEGRDLLQTQEYHDGSVHVPRTASHERLPEDVSYEGICALVPELIALR